MGNGSGESYPTVVKIDDAPDKSQSKPLTLEEYVALVARLEGLRHRGAREDPAWKAELVAALTSTPILDPISKMLEATPSENFEHDVTQVIDAALRVLKASSPAALGDGLRYLVAQEVEQVIWQSKTVMVMRWGALALGSILGAALVGGTLWGTLKVDGLLKLAKDTEVAIEKDRDEVRAEASKAQDAIRNLGNDAQKKIDEQINQEVVARTKKLDQLFDDVQKTTNTKVGNQLDALSRVLGTLNSEYATKSATVFKDHNDATDKLWQTQEQNWIAALKDKSDVVVSHFTTVQSTVDNAAQTFQTNLNTTLGAARDKEPALERHLGELEQQSTGIDKKFDIVNQHLSIVDEHVNDLAATHRQLDALIGQLNELSQTAGLHWLLRMLEIKDWLALAAIIFAVVSFLFALLSILLTGRSARRLAGPGTAAAATKPAGVP